MRTRHTTGRSRRAAGFTLVELLLVVVIIALLISITAAALTGALGSARRAATEQFLTTIHTAIEQFENDFNYYPPLVDGAKHAIEAQGRSGGVFDADARRDELREVRYHSIFSLTMYLVGVGEVAPPDFLSPGEPNYERRHDGVEGPGFRDPGPDRSWGGAAERADHAPSYVGRVYGPYLDLASTENIRRVQLGDLPLWNGDPMEPPTTDDGHPYFPDGDEDGVGADGRGDLFVLVDRWDRPIRYYRYWPTRDPDTRDFSFEQVPIELLNNRAVGALRHAAGESGMLEQDPVELDRDILMQPNRYALLSAGANQEFGDTYPGENDGLESWVATDPESDGQSFFDLNRRQREVVSKRLSDNIRSLP